MIDKRAKGNFSDHFSLLVIVILSIVIISLLFYYYIFNEFFFQILFFRDYCIIICDETYFILVCVIYTIIITYNYYRSISFSSLCFSPFMLIFFTLFRCPVATLTIKKIRVRTNDVKVRCAPVEVGLGNFI